VQPVAAVRARVLIAAGRSDEALEWANGTGIGNAATEGVPGYASEYDLLTWARLQMALRRGDDEALAELAAASVIPECRSSRVRGERAARTPER